MGDDSSALVALLSDEEAFELDNQIRTIVGDMAERWVQLQQLIELARVRHLWETLGGFKSHSDYVSSVFEGAIQIENTRDRVEKVTFLHNQDFSSRAIGKIIGVDQSTVVRDLERSTVRTSSDATASLAESDKPADSAPSVQFSDGDKRTGLDGRKRKPRAKPVQPDPVDKPISARNRRGTKDDHATVVAWAEQASTDLHAVAQRLRRMREDERYILQHETVYDSYRRLVNAFEHVAKVAALFESDYGMSEPHVKRGSNL